MDDSDVTLEIAGVGEGLAANLAETVLLLLLVVLHSLIRIVEKVVS